MKSIFFFCMISSLVCKSQMPDYYVFLVKGEVSLLKKEPRPVQLKQGAFVFKANQLELKKGAEVTLVNHNQEYFVVRKPGLVNVRDLLRNKTGEKASGLTAKYLEFLWDDLFNPNYDYSTFKDENLGGVHGGVLRYEKSCNNLVYPIENLQTSVDSLHFTWRQTSSTSKYHLIIYDTGKQELANIPVNDTSIILNAAQTLKGGPGDYYWLIKGENPGCEDEVPGHFKLITANEEQRLASLVSNMNGKGLDGELKSITALEKVGLIDAASSRYKKMLRQHANDSALMKTYILFLLKYKFDRQADFFWKERFLQMN